MAIPSDNLKTNYLQMKRTCHGNKIYGGGTKGHVNIIREANFHGMEFHKYTPKFQYFNNNIYL